MKNTNENRKTVSELYVESVETAVKNITVPAADIQVNAVSNRNYQGMNNLILLQAKRDNQFSSNRWYTQDYLNSKESEFQVIKGQKGTRIYSSKLVPTGEIKTKQGTNEEYQVKQKVITYYYVFNECQIGEKSA